MSEIDISQSIDWSVLSADELKRMSRAIATEKFRRKKRNRHVEQAEKVAQLQVEYRRLRDLAKEIGFPIGRLENKKFYRDPANETRIWTNRGRMPKWLAAYVESGRDIAEFEIDPQTLIAKDCVDVMEDEERSRDLAPDPEDIFNDE